MNDINPKFVVGVIIVLGAIGILIQLPRLPSVYFPTPPAATGRMTSVHVEESTPAHVVTSAGTESRPVKRSYEEPPPRIIERPVVPPKSTEEIAAERAAQAALERQEFLERYVNANVARPADKKLVAFVASSEDGKPSGAVNAALSKRLKTDAVEVTGSLIKGAFVTDGLFNQVFDGSATPLERLELSGKADGVFLARHSITYTKNPNLENVITASIRVETQVIHLPANTVAGGWTFRANGSGFSEADARLQAEERLVKQLEKDTNVRAFPE